AIFLLLRDQMVEVRVEQLRCEQRGSHRVRRRREMEWRERVLTGVILGIEGEETRRRNRGCNLLCVLHRATTIGSGVSEAVHGRQLGPVAGLGLTEPLPTERIGAVEP